MKIKYKSHKKYNSKQNIPILSIILNDIIECDAIRDTGATTYISYNHSKQVLELNGNKFKSRDIDASTVNGKISACMTEIKSLEIPKFRKFLALRCINIQIVRWC